MSRIILILGLFLTLYNIEASLVNLNPDPDGDPWWVGELRPLTSEDWQKLAAMPVLTLPDAYRNRTLPYRVDNSLQPYFRPIFSQEGGSCGQASGVGYNFTYEIDYLRQLPADNPDNQYPTHYTWNFLNGGEGYGSWYWDGWEIIRNNGCPNVTTYGGMAFGGHSRWMTGYNNYLSGMPNRVLQPISLNVGSPEGLEILKHWLNDHLEEAEVGGLANFAAGVSPMIITTLPPDSPEAGSSIVISWDAAINHAMTFIGYDDSIRYDYNGDGQYTNHIDINSDGMVDMKDWEIGGLIVANSWGLGWADQGKAYMMYRLLAEDSENGGIWANTVHVITTREIYVPLVTLKATIKHTSRNKIRISTGIASDPDSTEPELIKHYPLFNYQGGDFYMQGGTTEQDKTIEIGLDITSLLSGIINGQPASIFLIIDNQDPENVGEGEIVSFSVIDYLEGGQETDCPDTDIPIINNAQTTASVVKTFSYDAVQIITETLPEAEAGVEYIFQLTAGGGTPPYQWDVILDYQEEETIDLFPSGEENLLVPTNYDDGYAIAELDFSFPFYNEFHDQILVSTDGSILFGEEFLYIRNEDNLMASRAITPYGTDLMIYPEFDEGIWFSGDENSARIHWKTSRYNQPEFDAEFCVMLYADGLIEFYYNPEYYSSSPDWAAGISRGDQSSFTLAGISGLNTIPPFHKAIFSKPDYPAGMILSQSGLLVGIPEESDQTWELNLKVTDYNDIYSTKTLLFSTFSTSLDEHMLSYPAVLNNYPNPFNPSTLIEFSLPEECQAAELNIMNVKGQLVRRFSIDPASCVRVEGRQQPGYQIVWDGKDENGLGVGSGIYFYELRSETIHLSRKMLLLK
ncbi:MAG: hypothetical protein JW784_00565 [Candidatus Cloacimonetes bacterium]|nr:hypothetical protein [Candidatus Cloacimonadota bacterium]